MPRRCLSVRRRIIGRKVVAERPSSYRSAAMMRLPGDAPRVYCAGNHRKTRRPAMTVMPRAVDKAPERGNAGAADLRDAAQASPHDLDAGGHPAAGARARQAPDARCHRHRLCVRPLRLRPQGHDRDCRPRRRGQRARDRPAGAAAAARCRAHQRHPGARPRLRRHALGRHHPCHRQPVADGVGNRRTCAAHRAPTC